jgi:hypothetical protein
LSTTPKEKPHFIIKNNFQKRDEKYSDILTQKILQDVCLRVTGRTDYTIDFDNDGYNKGRLAKIAYNGVITYVSFSEKEIQARNSTLQSFPTAFTQWFFERNHKKRICFYFLKPDGNIATSYLMYNYRLMATLGVEFLNSNEVLNQKIISFNSIDDIITNKESLKVRNSSNNSTYITKNSDDITEIYAKTYGASKYESVLLAIAASNLAKKVKLYEILEQDLKELPAISRKLLNSLKNIEVIPTDLTQEKQSMLVYPSGLRSPRYIMNLGLKLGAKKCAFCTINDPKVIEGAHIWPVAIIKRQPDLSEEEQIAAATDGDNGIWLCKKHHLLFDAHNIRINECGELKIRSSLKQNKIQINKINTPISVIEQQILTVNFVKYLKKRDEILPPETDYVSLNLIV